MTKRKLQRFDDLTTMQRVFQYPYHKLEQVPDFKGNWNKNVFLNKAPIVVELGCGRGEYTIGLSKNDASKNYIGVDIKGARLWRGAKTANEEDLKHVAFLRTHIELLDYFFAENELSEIWITFPDPQPILSRIKKRLTHPRFMDNYRKFLKSGGVLHLKTDNFLFYEYTLEVLKNYDGDFIYKSADLYANPPEGFDDSIKTTYEQKFLSQGMKICYLSYRFK